MGDSGTYASSSTMSSFTAWSSLKLQQPSLVARFHELMHESCRGGEALLAGGQAKGERDMGLAGSRVAERDDVLAAQDERAAGKLQHQHLVE